MERVKITKGRELKQMSKLKMMKSTLRQQNVCNLLASEMSICLSQRDVSQSNVCLALFKSAGQPSLFPQQRLTACSFNFQAIPYGKLQLPNSTSNVA